MSKPSQAKPDNAAESLAVEKGAYIMPRKLDKPNINSATVVLACWIAIIELALLSCMQNADMRAKVKET